MDSSPLPNRSRPAGSFTSSSIDRRNPFTIAKTASLSRSNSSFSSNKSSSASLQAKPHTTQPTQIIQRPQRSQKTQKAQPRGRSRRADDSDDDDVEDDDDDEDDDYNVEEEEDDIEDSDKAEEEEDEDIDDEEDELAKVGGFANSPYFTQPTQAITQPVTQPTQLLKKPPLTLGGGKVLDTVPINIPSSSPPRSIIEVPASSPFQSPKPQALPATSIVARGRLANLMAPVGTSYRSPAAQALPKTGPSGRRNMDDDDDDDRALDNIISIDDSSDDDNDRRRRGDIRPSSFRSPDKIMRPAAGATKLHTEQEQNGDEMEEEGDEADILSSPPAANPTISAGRRKMNEKMIDTLVKKVRTELNRKNYANVSTELCRKTLIKHNYNVEEAVKDIFDDILVEEQNSKQRPIAVAAATNSIARPSPIARSKVPEMIRSFSYQGSSTNATNTANTSRSSTPATPSSQVSLKRANLSPDPRPKRRRLVQGRKYRDTSSQVGSPAVDKKAVEEASLVDLDRSVSDDDDGIDTQAILISDDEVMEIADDDDDEVVGSDEEEDDIDDSGDVEKRVLEYFNTCTVDDLVAMLGAKARGKAETILSQRPFRSRASVTRIQTEPTGGRNKKRAANIGEDIFDAVEEYVIALRAIDVVVSQCDSKGLQIRSTLHRWNVDFRGSSKLKPATDASASDGLLTPASEPDGSNSIITTSVDKNLSYVPLPIPQEPEFMRGHCTMKAYQLYGMNWLWELYKRKFGCILADDMGLGKTCQVISFLSHLVESYDGDIYDEDSRPWPNTVIVPPSTLANWKAEFARFAPDVRVIVYNGSTTERDGIFYKIQEHRHKYHVVLASYSQVTNKQDVDAMRKISPNVAIFDEGHKMKNSATNVYKSLKRIRANWRLILTGTPVQNNLMEMINLLNFIQPTLFEKHLEKLGALFSQRFTLQDVSNGALLFSDRVRRARQILEPFILQRRKEQVLSGMPIKTSRVVCCELDETQKIIYSKYEKKFLHERQRRAAGLPTEVDKEERRAAARSAVTGVSNDQNNVWVQLRKAAIHAQLFRRYYDDAKVDKMAEILMKSVPAHELRQPHIKHLVNELRGCSDFELHTWCRDYKCIEKFDTPDGLFLQSGKVRELLSLVREFQKNGDRALVFTRFARVLNILRECLEYEGINYVSLEGATRVDDRQDIINEFNNDPDIPVFLLTTGSGGTGINLTAANKVIIFDQSDNPQDDVQAENRAHRLGQTRPVEVIKLVTQDTIEELVYKACQTKLELAQRVTAGSASRAEELEAAEWGNGDKMAKAVEEEVVRMMLDQKKISPGEGATTPPKSEDSDAEEVVETNRPRRSRK